MAAGLGGVLARGEELNRAARQRRRKHEEMSVPLADLAENTEAYTKHGWTVRTKYKYTARLRRPKQVDELLEDEVWLLFKNMGFTEMSKDRAFKVQAGPVKKQVDVFARDESLVFVVECKASSTGAAISASDIRELSDLRSDIFQPIRNHYRDIENLMVSFVIAARGMRWSKANAVLAADKKIIVWREAELEYYGRLVKHLGSAARFQIYSITFPEARVREPIQVPAIRGGKGKGKYYCFVTQPDKLLQVAYVHHRRSTPQELQESYQRMLNRSRLNRISDFITGGGYFANNIIINFIERPTFRPFPKQQQAGEVAFGMLEFPREYASAWIIDGQHRLYGYADNPKKQDATVAVLAFDRLPVKEQAKLFVDINREQKAVPPNLLWDLYSDIYYDSPEAQDQTWRTISLVVKRLDSDKDSPLRDHVRIPSVTPKGRSMTNLTMATVCEALKETRLLNATEGLLYATDYESTVEFAAQRLKAYLSLAAHAFPQDWGKGDRGLLRTNIGIRILLIILKEILLYFRNLGEERIYKRSDLSEFRTRTEKLLRPMLDKLDEIGDAGRNGIRRQTAKGLVLDNARQIAWEIRETFEGFGLELLRNWAPPVPSGVTDEDIRSLLQDTERRLRSFIAQELETLYGKRWWGQGVPAGVKSGVATRVEREVRRAPFRDELRRLPPARRMNYTDTPHLREIIEYGRNWDHFKHLFVEDKEFTSVQFRCFELVRHKYAHHAEEELDEIEKNQGYWGMKWIRRCRGWDTPRA